MAGLGMAWHGTTCKQHGLPVACTGVPSTSHQWCWPGSSQQVSHPPHSFWIPLQQRCSVLRAQASGGGRHCAGHGGLADCVEGNWLGAAGGNRGHCAGGLLLLFVSLGRSRWKWGPQCWPWWVAVAPCFTWESSRWRWGPRCLPLWAAVSCAHAQAVCGCALQLHTASSRIAGRDGLLVRL